MQQQYNQIKQDHPDDIVLFRLGDFYEAFDNDAEVMSQVLGITLTGRGKGDTRTPMAGIPYHALDNYLPRLVDAGHKVVLVEQTTEPKPGQLVERAIAKIYTAGTITEENTLSENQNNFLASIYFNSKSQTFGIAFADVSTGLVQVFQTGNTSALKSELSRISPSEIIIPRSQLSDVRPLTANLITIRPDNQFEFDLSYGIATGQLGTTNLKGFGIEEFREAIQALGALFTYIQECQRANLDHLKQVRIYHTSDYMLLDSNTIRNLELVFPSSGTDLSATVYAVLNQAKTNMGKRLLRNWLLRPLINEEKLLERWDSTETFYVNSILVEKLRESLKQVADIERILGRVGVGSANARDLLALKDSLRQIQQIADQLTGQELSHRLQHLVYGIDLELILQICKLIETAIYPDPPITITEGSIIASGYDSEVDRLRELSQGGKQTLAGIQAREAERTGISSLKVSYNKVFGYYIEITNSHSSKVPADYIRKQTLANAERYITPELKDWEDQIINAEGSLMQLEYKLFVEIRNQIASQSALLLQIGEIIAEIDIYANFGYLARQYQYVKPVLSSAKQLEISAGRHPVIERLQSEFTSNDVHFNDESEIILLTGPNMSGKSTYIRQTALLILLAQIGSFVPADKMEFSIVDRIFTRVGAGDNLSRGESTFMVEMNETANILNNATENSLIILDEVGRGTSTYDGVAIAWSIVEDLAERCHAFTLFATHYHELIELDQKYKNISNYNVLVSENAGQILFQHKIAKGSTSKSYGIHVAEMAGVPKQIVARAEEILGKFEASASQKKTKIVEGPKRPKHIAAEQLGLLD